MQGLRGIIGMNSSLYFGEVRHHRRSPKKHDLRYKLYMPHLFLDEVNEVFKDRWLWSVDRSNLSSFQRKDYHASQKPSLEDAVRETISEQTGAAVKGPVSVLTHLRTFGHCFNPVTFYYVWDPKRPNPMPSWSRSPTPHGASATPKPFVGLTRIRTVPPSRSTDSKKNSTYLPSSG